MFLKEKLKYMLDTGLYECFISSVDGCKGFSDPALILIT